MLALGFDGDLIEVLRIERSLLNHLPLGKLIGLLLHLSSNSIMYMCDLT